MTIVNAQFLGWRDDFGNPQKKPLHYWDDLVVGRVYKFIYSPSSLYQYQLSNGAAACRGDEVMIVPEGPINLDDYL